METLHLARQGSSVPVSTCQIESCVILTQIGKAWTIFKNFHLDKVVPGHVKSTEWVSGGFNQLDSVVRINYTDGAKWEIRINEISDVKHTLGYQVLMTEPAHQVTSITGQFHFRRVTDDDTTYIEWITDYSNDVDANVIMDQKYKKLEFFKDLKNTLSAKK